MGTKILAPLLLALACTSCLATQAAQEDLSRATAALNERIADAESTDTDLAAAIADVKAAVAAVPEAAKQDAIDLGGAFSTQGIGTTLVGLAGLWAARNATRKKGLHIESAKDSA